MIEETPQASEPASKPTPTPKPQAADSGVAADAASPNGDAPKKKRRRGTRGGRNRNKNRTTATGSAGGESGTGGSGGGTGANRPVTEPGSEHEEAVIAKAGPRRATVEERSEDWDDASADRGITTDDVAATAKEEAGFEPRVERPQIGASRPAAKPKIGDSRPAPAAAAVAPAGEAKNGEAKNGEARAGGGEGTGTRRRRRRGGRGRGKKTGADAGASTSAGGSASAAASATASARRSLEPVTAELEFEAAIDIESLDEATLERRRGKTRKGRATGRYTMCVHAQADGPTQIGLLEGRALTEHYVSWPQDDAMSIDGNIYLGKVQNVLPGMEAAFVDIGTPKNGVIYRSDVMVDTSDTDAAPSKREKPRIEQMLKNGQTVLVQVIKNPIAHKGARLTMEVSLAGRFVVMVPGHPETYGISKRLPDDERKRLRKVLDRVRPKDAGLIVRTAAEGATEEELERDMQRLAAQWKQIEDLAKRSKGGTLLYKEPPLAVRVIREEFTKEYRSVIIDDESLYNEVKGYVDAVAPELADRVELYEDDELPMFERYHVHEQLVKALDKKVWLPSGGSLIIERTEALTVIDVNTGKNVGKSNLEETVYRNNLEAAEEVARQLRLRDIGGIIVIDFIDMEIKENQTAVVRVLRDALARDKTRTQVFDISELGLVEMTRKRISEGLVESFSHVCESCAGRGIVVDESLL